MAWKPGQSGNPGGRPKELREIAQLSREHSKEAIERLVFWMRSEDPRASTAACNAILDRGYGKPTQPIGGDEDNPLRVAGIEMHIIDHRAKP